MASSLKTALRDAALIVVSILIAFALDAWWDGQSRAAEQREALSALQAELEGSRAELDSVVAFNEAQIERIDQVLERGDAAGSSDESGAIFRALLGGLTFDPSLSAVEAILAGGLDRISDSDLRAAIAAWPGVLREIQVDQRIMVDEFISMSNALVMQGLHVEVSRALWSESAPAELTARVTSDEMIRQRLSALRSSISSLNYELSDVESRLEELETQVDIAIGN